MSRFKSYKLWLGIFSLVALICQGYGLKILPDNYEQITTTILGVLVAAGIISTHEE